MIATTDTALVAHQLQTLSILDEVHRSTAMRAAAAGCGFGLLGFSCPAMGVVGSLLDPYTTSPMVHRMANTPIWVMAIVVVCGLFLGGVGVVLGWMQRNAGAPALRHLRKHSDDPLVSATYQHFVMRRARTLHITFTTRRGETILETVDAAFEDKVHAAIAAALPAPGS